MLAFYKGKKYLIISLLAIILDGVISYFLPSYFNKISYLYPMFTISLIPFLSHSDNKKNLVFIFIIGLIYNLLYSNVFLYHSLVFIMLAKLDYIFLKIFKENILSYIALVTINIILYDSLYFLLIILTNYQIVTFNDLIYKIEKSLPINIMSVFVYHLIVQKSRKLHKM